MTQAQSLSLGHMLNKNEDALVRSATGGATSMVAWCTGRFQPDGGYYWAGVLSTYSHPYQGWCTIVMVVALSCGVLVIGVMMLLFPVIA